MNFIKKNTIILLFSMGTLLTFSNAMDDSLTFKKFSNGVHRFNTSEPIIDDSARLIEKDLVALGKGEGIEVAVSVEKIPVIFNFDNSLVMIAYNSTKPVYHMIHLGRENLSLQPQKYYNEERIPLNSNINIIVNEMYRIYYTHGSYCSLIFYSDLDEDLYIKTVSDITLSSNLRGYIKDVHIIPLEFIAPRTAQYFDFENKKLRIVNNPSFIHETAFFNFENEERYEKLVVWGNFNDLRHEELESKVAELEKKQFEIGLEMRRGELAQEGAGGIREKVAEVEHKNSCIVS